LVSPWIPLGDATPDRGGLQVIPRTHIGEIIRYRRTAGGSVLELADDVLPLSAGITFPLRAGGALLLTNKTPHRSTDTATDVIRRICDPSDPRRAVSERRASLWGAQTRLGAVAGHATRV
jgi:hypothetical protein